jgi:hypothetical protein
MIVLGLLGAAIRVKSRGDDIYLLGSVVSLLAWISGLSWCVSYPKGKGYSAWLGLLGLGIPLFFTCTLPLVVLWAGLQLGLIIVLLLVIGALVLVLLPDRSREDGGEARGSKRPASDRRASRLPSKSGLVEGKDGEKESEVELGE